MAGSDGFQKSKIWMGDKSFFAPRLPNLGWAKRYLEYEPQVKLQVP
jgi:hypothetical protein